MADKPELLTAEQLNAMTPNERSEAFDARIVTDLDELPEDFRQRIVSSATRLGQERETPPSA